MSKTCGGSIVYKHVGQLIGMLYHWTCELRTEKVVIDRVQMYSRHFSCYPYYASRLQYYSREPFSGHFHAFYTFEALNELLTGERMYIRIRPTDGIEAM